MNKEEILRYIRVGSRRCVTIDISNMDRYPGYVREVQISENSTVCIEFNVYNHEYGGLTFYFRYKNYEDLIASMEQYLNKKVECWENYNRTGSYPLEDEYADTDEGVRMLIEDLKENKIILPEGFMGKELKGGFWKDSMKR